MNSKDYFYFAGRCLMLDENPEFAATIREKINSDGIDWEKFVLLCSNHLILPAIYLKFKRNNLIPDLPEELTDFLKEIYELNLLRNKQIINQLSEITLLLNQNNIFPIYLKGAAHLLEGVYSDIGERILGDIDLLVAEKDYQPAAKALEAIGYSTTLEPHSYFDTDLSKHYPPLTKPGLPAYLEVHRQLTEVELDWFNPGIVETQKKSVHSLNGCFVLSDHHKIIHNFIHAHLSHGGSLFGILSLRDLYDLHLLSVRNPLEETISEIRYKKKAIAYFSFESRALGLDNPFAARAKFRSWYFRSKHDLNQTSRSFYFIHRAFAYIKYKIAERYMVQTIAFFRTKKMRRVFAKRLSDPGWYKLRIKEYLNIFTGKDKA